MDIVCFLKERTKFIKYYYENGILPFEHTKQLIENGLAPYEPPYSEDSEPPFLSEWLDADTAFDTVGHTALTMLSSSVQLYLKEWIRQIEQWSRVEITVNFKKNNGLRQYSEIFDKLGFSVRPCPANVDLIEQILLVRNRIQHPEQLTSLNIEHSQNDLKKYPKPFFARESEYSYFSNNDNVDSWLIQPSVTVTKEMVIEAISQVEIFCTWLDNEYWKCRDA
ncbi:hypothetical protein JYB88_09515 [Shewanella cyperi]|uniref:Uncharacterized protein n=1 Tax=Shewanella cyperi TaxID=2814292 RepID=A0A975AIS3_9GAMM|nr:hypothetical protein [Shewanella cyperi]QSX28542.1 hypothetical protein JYB88_09515 [Shewanella cyperi]